MPLSGSRDDWQAGQPTEGGRPTPTVSGPQIALQQGLKERERWKEPCVLFLKVPTPPQGAPGWILLPDQAGSSQCGVPCLGVWSSPSRSVRLAHLLRFPMGRINLVTKVQQGSCPGGDGALPLLFFPFISLLTDVTSGDCRPSCPGLPSALQLPVPPAWHLCVELALCTVHGAA